MEKWNFSIEEIKQNEIINKKHQKVYRILDLTEYFLILASAVTESVSIYAFASLIGILVDIASSAVEIKIFAITAVIKKCKSTIKKK